MPYESILFPKGYKVRDEREEENKLVGTDAG